MRLEVTRKSDLAVRALRALAGDGARLKAPALAAAVGSTPGFVAQVMTPLVRAGWVTSDPGPTGGYLLAVDLTSLSVLAVIEAIEGPTESGRCVLDRGPCGGSRECALHAAWVNARAELLVGLDAMPVADGVVRGAPPGSGLSRQAG